MNLDRRDFLAALGVATLAKAASLADIPLGVTTDEIDEDVDTAAAFLERFGLHHAEIRQIWGKYNTSHSLERIREAKSILDKHSVRTAILSTGFFKIPLPADNTQGHAVLDNQWSLLDSAMERAAIFGTDKIRVFAFTYKDGEKPDPAAYPRIYELVKEAA
ncbi:MAG: hypothetical protein U0Q16_14245, partial [Bryobacteraceae bacterium]